MNGAEEVIGPIIALVMMGIGFIFMMVYFLFIFLMVAISITSLVIWVLMVIDVIRRDDKDFPDQKENEKLMWLLIVLLTGAIGAIIYYFMVYKKMKDRRREQGNQTKTQNKTPAKRKGSK